MPLQLRHFFVGISLEFERNSQIRDFAHDHLVLHMPDPCLNRTSPETEWLFTDGLGGYAMGTASGTLTRRYHGLLVAAQSPPVERVVLVSQVVEKLTVDGHEHWLTPMRFASSEPATSEVAFEIGRVEGTLCAVWRFERDGIQVEKCLERGVEQSAAMLTYSIHADRPCSIELRPLLALRDFHDLRTPGGNRTFVRYGENLLTVQCNCIEVCIHTQGCQRIDEHEVWSDLLYTHERDRGQDCVETLFVPCRYVARCEPGTTEILIAMSDQPDEPVLTLSTTVPGCEHALGRIPEQDICAREAVSRLVAAADQFIVQRGGVNAGQGISIIAGYPWFSDWGRDTMIALPGLLLDTGRFNKALATLRVFGGAIRHGLIPNRFDDYAGAAHYNTVDASLWFLHAAAAYREAASDHAAYRDHLAKPCLEIIHAYRTGTDYGIHMDTDGLIAAGSPETQLTWMDAQRDGITFTPRYGKCVEINALWHHGLIRTAESIQQDQPDTAADLTALAARVRTQFAAQFVNPQGGLYDRLEPDAGNWVPSREIRPNQIFAASLSASPADLQTRRSIVETVEEHLLTPFGLRTLAPSDPGYIGTYSGPLFERDAAYHNGTVWPWLIGPYIEAFLRVHSASPEARAKARTAIMPLTERMDAYCLGQVSEVCDGDPPHLPDGCPAQAWSVAELLRTWIMIAGKKSLDQS